MFFKVAHRFGNRVCCSTICYFRFPAMARASFSTCLGTPWNRFNFELITRIVELGNRVKQIRHFEFFEMSVRMCTRCVNSGGWKRVFAGRDVERKRKLEMLETKSRREPVENRPTAQIRNSKDKNRLLPPRATTKQKIMMLSAVLIPPLGLIAAMALLWQYGWMGWSYLAMVVAGWLITVCGVTVGFHRLLSHRSFETYGWVKTIWAMVGALSVQGNPLVWCAVHRRHHERSDKEGDPHSPNLHGSGVRGMLKGLWHGQIGWLFSGFWSFPDMKRYIPDLLKQKSLVAVGNCYGLFVVLSLAIPAGIGYLIEGPFGALLGFIWGGLVRVFITHHITWSINSICHVFGQRPYDAGDQSTNNFVCGVLALGEGWHNNHHAFPSLAKFGFRWWQFDFSWWVIQTMRVLGLAWNVKTPTPDLLESKARSTH